MKARTIRKPLAAIALALAILGPGVATSACSQGDGNVSVGVDAIVFMKRATTTVDPVTKAVSID
ncbi:MAG TPA: hypothetical protein VLM85_26630, partial [Polyangiaceae bacterium]|nr:hypothetical protein [Polyangiaceae bacterium]